MKINWVKNLFGITDKAIEQVGNNANPVWMEEALSAVERMATIHDTFTTDAVWAVLKTKTHEPRAMGAVMRISTKRGIIAPTGYHTPSNRKASHRRPLQVWQSLIKVDANGVS